MIVGMYKNFDHLHECDENVDGNRKVCTDSTDLPD